MYEIITIQNKYLQWSSSSYLFLFNIRSRKVELFFSTSFNDSESFVCFYSSISLIHPHCIQHVEDSLSYISRIGLALCPFIFLGDTKVKVVMFCILTLNESFHAFNLCIFHHELSSFTLHLLAPMHDHVPYSPTNNSWTKVKVVSKVNNFLCWVCKEQFVCNMI